MAHVGRCNCATPDGLCRWNATKNGTLHPLKAPEALGKVPASLARKPPRLARSTSAAAVGESETRSEAAGGFLDIPADELIRSGILAGESDGQQVEWSPGGFDAKAKTPARGTRRSVSSHSASKLVTREDFQEAAARYPALAKTNGRARSTFMPFSGHRTDPVHTHDGCQEHEELSRRRVQMNVLRKTAHTHLANNIGPVDAKWLHNYGHKAVKDKLRERLLFEGYSAEHARRVRREMMNVLHETPKLNPNPDDARS